MRTRTPEHLYLDKMVWIYALEAQHPSARPIELLCATSEPDVKSPNTIHLALAATRRADAFLNTDNRLTHLTVLSIG